ncbi:hypothetical protein SBA4_3050004 [Candidatus Sulfopaludibacter sp. SbA4]|nr:hypothetical protein SBA4_3050004 [Candidatus Sulfopaludibacter sp. SbA4]
MSNAITGAGGVCRYRSGSRAAPGGASFRVAGDSPGAVEDGSEASVNAARQGRSTLTGPGVWSPRGAERVVING